MSFEDKGKRVTLSGRPAAPGMEDAPAPQPIDGTGMHGDYWVLSEEERAKGFVRPVRRSYTHRGERPRYPLRDLTPEEKERYAVHGYVAFEAYPADSGILGTYWTEKRLKSGCGSATRVGLALCETYARDPKFYGSTFCCACGAHFPVAEFTWDEGGDRVGT